MEVNKTHLKTVLPLKKHILHLDLYCVTARGNNATEGLETSVVRKGETEDL